MNYIQENTVIYSKMLFSGLIDGNILLAPSLVGQTICCNPKWCIQRSLLWSGSSDVCLTIWQSYKLKPITSHNILLWILSIKNLLTLKWQQSIFSLKKMASIIETPPLQQEELHKRSIIKCVFFLQCWYCLR